MKIFCPVRQGVGNGLGLRCVTSTSHLCVDDNIRTIFGGALGSGKWGRARDIPEIGLCRLCHCADTAAELELLSYCPMATGVLSSVGESCPLR